MGKHIYDEDGNHKGEIVSEEEHNRRQYGGGSSALDNLDYNTFGGRWVYWIIGWVFIEIPLVFLDVMFEFLPSWYLGINSEGIPWSIFVIPFLLTCCSFWKQLYFLLKKYINK